MNYQTINNNELLEKFPEVHYYINKYYPIGTSKDKKEYHDYLGTKNLETEINKNILNKINYEKNWSDGFISKLKAKINSKEVYPSTSGLVPNLSGLIKLDTNKSSPIELHFYKSLINGYFSIEILEINNNKKIVHPILGEKTVTGIDKIIVSPTGKYKDIFLQVFECITNEFENSKFIPYIFDMIRIEKLEVMHKLDNNSTISGALFQKYSVYKNSITLIGDIKYKISELK